MAELSNRIVAPLSAVEDPGLRDEIARSINLMDNGIRTVVGKVLVARAVGGRLTDDGVPHDVESANGTQLTVLVGGLVQTWFQDAHSFIVWDVARRPLLVPDGNGGHSATEQMSRWSDVHVFATHTGARPGTASEWRFRVVPTARIDDECGDRHSITSSWIDDRLHPVACGHDGLAAAVAEISGAEAAGVQ